MPVFAFVVRNRNDPVDQQVVLVITSIPATQRKRHGFPTIAGKKMLAEQVMLPSREPEFPHGYRF